MTCHLFYRQILPFSSSTCLQGDIFRVPYMANPSVPKTDETCADSRPACGVLSGQVKSLAAALARPVASSGSVH